MPGPTTLLFVHNLDSGVLQSLHDYSTSKVAGPGSDGCALSRITHSPVGIKKEWKRFLKELTIPSRSLDRNEFFAEFGQRPIALPAVILRHGAELSVLISAEELRACGSLGDFIALIQERLSGG
jgi:hypothetical protein